MLHLGITLEILSKNSYCMEELLNTEEDSGNKSRKKQDFYKNKVHIKRINKM